MDAISRPLPLLILTSREEAAKDLIGSLRSAGLAVRGIFTNEPERLEELSKSSPFELILCCQYDPAVDLDACLSYYRRLVSDVALIVIADATTDSAVLFHALRSGARVLTEHGDKDHLQLVVARELSDLQHRRAEARLRERLEECEQTHRQAGKGLKSGPVALDADTGLPNRTALMCELDSRLTETVSGGTPFAVIYVGINAFPKLLHSKGLVSGLEVAADIGSALQILAPQRAYLARVGDGGYVLLIPDLRQAGADKLAATIKRDLSDTLEQAPQEGQTLQCSVGLTLASSATRCAADLLDSAYRDYLFSLLAPISEPGMTEPSRNAQGENASEDNLRVTARVKHALDVDGFQLVYQPIVSLKGDSQETYNVLLRLREDNGTLREAKDFLPAAIESGIMVAIDRWVLRNAIARVAAQRSAGRKVSFFVNLAEQTLQEKQLLIWICDNLREFQARGNWVTLQILEEHARRNAAVVSRLSEGLRKVKCRVAINRFGEGPNPEHLLRSLRLDYAKLPPNLCAGLANDQRKQQRLRELTEVCRNAGVKSVVTGVEDASSLTVVWTAGVDYVQGYFLLKPSPFIGKGQ
jgi:multidomain signaling protein FimX